MTTQFVCPKCGTYNFTNSPLSRCSCQDKYSEVSGAKIEEAKSEELWADHYFKKWQQCEKENEELKRKIVIAVDAMEDLPYFQETLKEMGEL